MKTHFTLLTILLFICTTISAAPVNPTRALQIAQEFVPKQFSSSHGHHAPAAQVGEIVYTHYMPKSGKPALYVVNMGNAFAIVSADDVAHPILGYNYNKSWPTDGNIPPQVKFFFDDLAAQMEAASEHPQDAETAEEWNSSRKAPKRAKANDNLPDSVGPLLTTTWDQGQYYNALCPEDAQSQYDGHVLTGCVATAMAQIIKYWGDRETINTRGIHSYESNYGNLRVNYDSTSYNFTNMPTELTSQSTPTQVNAVATLMRDCGVAVNMIYGITESSSYDVDARAALINFFCMNPACAYAEKSFFSDDKWIEMLRTEIAGGRPILYSGFDYTAGHTFVCDGYKQSGYFSFNFGWNGNGDGWYLINAINPGIYNFESNQSALLNIEPYDMGRVVIGQTRGESVFIINEPMEFYHIMGHNAFAGQNKSSLRCNNMISFVSQDNSSQVVVDFVRFKYQNVSIYDGIGTNLWLGGFYTDFVPEAGPIDNVGPFVTSQNSGTIVYEGSAIYDGFELMISPNSDCRMVSNLTATIDESFIHLNWVERGNSTSWKVEYEEEGFDSGSGISFMVTSCNADIPISSLENPRKTYEFKVQPICDIERNILIKSKIVDIYWTDVVTTQPQGYTEDSQGNIFISSEQGLAWFSKLSQNFYSFNGRKIYLNTDINLKQYKWKPIGYFSGFFDGQSHQIDSLYSCEKGYKEVSLFSYTTGAVIRNVNITNCVIQSYGHTAGGLVCSGNADTIMNCSVSGRIIGKNSNIGALVSEPRNEYIINCYSNCEITTLSRSDSYAGGIIGYGMNNTVKNCYSASSIQANHYCDGSIAAYTDKGYIENCYGYLERNGDYPIVYPWAMGVTYKDIALFTSSENDLKIYNDSIYFELDNMWHYNLIDILNMGVRKYADEGIKTWIQDTIGINDGLPIFGNDYEPSCPNISSLVVKNAPQDAMKKYGVVLSWEEQGSATMWDVRYSIKDSVEEFTIRVSSNPDTIMGLRQGYTYIFSVRPVCADDDIGAWHNTVEIIVDKPYWTDIVTTCPEGYNTDVDGNIIISSAEGMAWLISVVNGLNGMEQSYLDGINVQLTQDIDLGQYKWTPIGEFWGNFNGGNHTIRGLYINESSNNQGFFSGIFKSTIQDVHFRDSYVKGLSTVGTIAGGGNKIKFINCSSNGIIYADRLAGGLFGVCRNTSVNLCSSHGVIYTQYGYAGGLCAELIDSEIYNSCSSVNINAIGLSASYAVGGLVDWLLRSSVTNCYATGNVQAYAYQGGLVGDMTGPASIHNIYSIGMVSGANDLYKAMIVGTIRDTVSINYAYAFRDDENLYPMIGNWYESVGLLSTSNLSWLLTSNIGEHSLLNPSSINEVVYSDLLSALNAWVDANNSEGQYRHWVADTENINGGFPIFAPHDGPATDIEYINTNASAEAVKVVRDGEIYILRGDKVYTITGQEAK